MKKRLLGMFSLVLCLAVVAVPVMGVAYFDECLLSYNNWSAGNSGEAKWVKMGALLPTGGTVWACVDDSYSIYTDTSKIQYDGMEGSFEGRGSHVCYATMNEAGTDGGYWRAYLIERNIDYENTSYKDLTLGVAKTGERKIETPVTGLDEEVYIFGFEGINGPHAWRQSLSFHEKSAKEIMAAFEDYINDPNNGIVGNTKVPYEVDAYTPVRLSNDSTADGDTANGDTADQYIAGWNRYTDEAPESGYTFTFPIKNIASENVTVLHWSKGKVTKEPDVTVTQEGVQVTVDSFSPFMVVYDVPVDSGSAAGGTSASGSQSASVPQTGDNAQLALWCALAALSLAGVTAIAIKRRKHA